MKRTTCLFKQIIPVVKMLLFSFHPSFVYSPFPSRFIIKTMLKQASSHSLIKVRHFQTRFPISLTWNFCFTLDSLYVSSAQNGDHEYKCRCLGRNSVKTGKLLNHAVPLVYVTDLFVCIRTEPDHEPNNSCGGEGFPPVSSCGFIGVTHSSPVNM